MIGSMLNFVYLKNYYAKNFSPSISTFHVVGNITEKGSLENLASLGENWDAKEVTIPEFPIANNRDKSSLYFVDIPDAKQSVINIGYVSLARTDKDFYPAEVMNYKLGGSFSVLNSFLRFNGSVD